MIRTIIDLIGFFNSLSGFLVAVFFWSILTITFAKSIKKHARFLYWVFGVMGGLSLLPILNIFGIDMVNIIYLPILGDIFIEFTYAGNHHVYGSTESQDPGSGEAYADT